MQSFTSKPLNEDTDMDFNTATNQTILWNQVLQRSLLSTK